MVQTRKSAIKRPLDDTPSSEKAFKDKVLHSTPKPRVREMSTGLASSAIIPTQNQSVPRSRLRKGSTQQKSSRSSGLKFIKCIIRPTVVWEGAPDIKYFNKDSDIIIYNKAKFGEDYLSAGDIVKLNSNVAGTLGQLTYLYEEAGKKKAEVRIFYPDHKGRYVETYEYYLITLACIIEKVLFTAENGYNCESLKDKQGTYFPVDPTTRLERSLTRSKFSIRFCDNNNSLRHAITLLTLSSSPSNLVGRTTEKEEILDFLKTSLNMKKSTSSLYICGMPGTGKTATFLYTIDQLKSSEEYSGLFTFIHVNCMKLIKPQEIYSIICREICRKKKSGHEALELINSYLKSSKKSGCVIILVDEIDALLNKKQDVLYNLFNWTNIYGSNFIVAGIANTMDLSDKFIHKVSSRMGNKQLVFAPYNRDQLQEIITKRLKDTNAFTPEAILFCAAKVASYSGDARRAFQVCKKAAFLALEHKQSKIGIEHIQSAFKQLFASLTIQAIELLPIYMKLVLATLCLDLKNNTKESAYIDQLYNRHKSYCEMSLNIQSISLKQVQVLINRLASLHLLSLDGEKVRLNVSPDDVIDGIKGEEDLLNLVALLQGN